MSSSSASGASAGPAPAVVRHPASANAETPPSPARVWRRESVNVCEVMAAGVQVRAPAVKRLQSVEEFGRHFPPVGRQAAHDPAVEPDVVLGIAVIVRAAKLLR